ncbi:MAG: ATP-binding protein, partial [Desulfobacteraceae bacterium]|nr:ATP-binding protein [Desulfobacteraceae bacterium]
IKANCNGKLFNQDGIDYFILVDKEDSGTGDNICISQVDLNSLTSSKAAMYTILEVIVCKTAGLSFDDLEKFYVAGTFGSFINPESAISIGMLPDMKRDKFKVLGNSSLGGATKLLTDRDAFDEAGKIRKSITYIELNVNAEFMNMFSGAKFYPHTDKSRFPSICSFE